MVRERQLIKIQKQRHLSNIRLMVLNNPLFKNLSERDQRKMIKLIYKAEMVEMHARDRNLIRVNNSFEEIMKSLIENAIIDDEDEGKGPFFDDER